MTNSFWWRNRCYDTNLTTLTVIVLLVVIWFYSHSHQGADSTFLPRVYADFTRPLQKCVNFKRLGALGSYLKDPKVHEIIDGGYFQLQIRRFAIQYYRLNYSNKLHLNRSSTVTYIDNFCNFSSCNLQCFSSSIFYTHQFCGVYFLMLCNLWLESQWVQRGWVNIIQ